MTLSTIIILLTIGIASGYLSGLMGLGGGIIIIPALVYFLGYSQLTAQGTTLGMLMLPVGFLAAFQYYKAGHIDVKSVLIIAVGFVAASYFGSKTATTIDQGILRKVFATALLLVALKMFFQK